MQNAGPGVPLGVPLVGPPRAGETVMIGCQEVPDGALRQGGNTRGMVMQKLAMWTAAAVVVSAGAGYAQAPKAPIELSWWHAMTAANNERVNKIADGFNATQSEWKVV